RGVRFLAPAGGILKWQFSPNDAPVGISMTKVATGRERDALDSVSDVASSVRVYRLEQLPTFLDLARALAMPQDFPLLAGWADAVADGDGVFTLSDLVLIHSRLKQ